MNSNLPNPIDPVDREIAERLAAAGADWQAVNTAELSKHQAMALQLLVWSGLLELRLTVRAWGGSSDTVVLAECIVSGDYRKALPDEIRKVAPSLGEGRVMVQPDAQVQFRLTISGTDARARLIETPMDPFVLVFAKRVLPGRVSVRIVNVEQAVRKDRPGAIAVAQAAASVGDIHVHVTPEPRLDAGGVTATTKKKPKHVKPAGTSAKPAPAGEYSPPMSKSQMMLRLRMTSRKVFDSFAKKHGLVRVNRQLWQIRTDTMPQNQADRLRTG
jgi:hypothetical protein